MFQLFQHLNEVVALSLAAEVPCLMEDIPFPMLASFLLATHMVDRNQVCDVYEKYTLLATSNQVFGKKKKEASTKWNAYTYMSKTCTK